MAEITYSFSSPMRAYKNIKKELTLGELQAFRQKYEKTLTFKQANFWCGSITGINQSGIAPTEKSLAISDALGRVYYFPYSLQNYLLSRLDSENQLGLNNLIKHNKSCEPFNWRQFTTNNMLIGYALNMMDNITSDEWDLNTYKLYDYLNNNIISGKIKGVFIPYYLAPKELKPYIRHSLLATKSVFGIGALVLFDTTTADMNPCAYIPDVDFITQFDLTPFSSLGFGQMYKEYLAKGETVFSYDTRYIRCNSPKPKALPLMTKKVSSGTGTNTNGVKKKNSKEDSGVLEEAMLGKLADLLHENAKFEDAQGVKCLSQNIAVNKDKLELKLTLLKSDSENVDYYPEYIDMLSQDKNEVPGFKPKNKQKQYFNVVYTYNKNSMTFDYTVHLGLYGTDKLCVEVVNGSITGHTLVARAASINSFLDITLEDSYELLVSNLPFSFDEQVIKGLFEGAKEAGLDVSSDIKQCIKNESENMYKLTFRDNSVYKSLEIQEKGTGLDYKLSLKDIDVENEPTTLNFAYTGDIEVIEAVKQLSKAAITTLQSMT